MVAEVGAFLRERLDVARARGVPDERLVIDPGHDLNKNTLHSLELTRRLDEIAAIGLPLLVALSNKDFIGESLGRRASSGSRARSPRRCSCIGKGARIVRVHNVRETVDAVRMVEAIEGWREPAFLEHNMPPGSAS